MNNNKIIIGISTRALFDLEYENKIYEEKGIEQYIQYQLNHENEILKPGTAFNLVKKFSGLMKREEMQGASQVEFILISRSCPDISIRIFNSIEHYNLPIDRGIFTGGKSTIPYIKELNIDLYLSANRDEIEQVKNHNIAAGLVVNSNSLKQQSNDNNGEVHIAFDCDCVLFGSESEDIYRSHGLKAFEENEMAKRNIPIEGGTFKELLIKLATIQSRFDYDDCPLRIAICTARGAVCSQRVINTFRSWNLRVNEAFFMNGLNKSPTLQAFRADIFFDDSISNIESASQVVPSVQVI